jgi:hypothetical protein
MASNHSVSLLSSLATNVRMFRESVPSLRAVRLVPRHPNGASAAISGLDTLGRPPWGGKRGEGEKKEKKGEKPESPPAGCRPKSMEAAVETFRARGGSSHPKSSRLEV